MMRKSVPMTKNRRLPLLSEQASGWSEPLSGVGVVWSCVLENNRPSVEVPIEDDVLYVDDGWIVPFGLSGIGLGHDEELPLVRFWRNL